MTKQSFFIKNNGKYERVNLSEIIYVSSCGNYLKIVTEEKTIVIHMGISKMEELLPRDLFCRVHRSYLVAIDKIQAFDLYTVYLSDQINIPLGKEFKSSLEQQLWLIQKEVEMSVLKAELSL